MKYVAAYMLASLSGNDTPALEDLKKIICSVGGEFNPDVAMSVISKIAGRKVEELIEAGKAKIGSFAIASGSGTAPLAVAAEASSSTAAEAKPEPAKEESDDDMGFGLFDD